MCPDHAATALPSSIRLVPEPLPRLDIATRVATAQIYLHGAHVAHWQPAHSPQPVLFMSGSSFFEAGKPIRGGVPICFPWFGAHPTDAGSPAHGFARLAAWTLDEAADGDDTVTVTLSLPGDRTRFAPAWSHPFRITHQISVGSNLSMTLEVRNEGAEPFTYSEALHTYFAVADIDQVAIHGLQHADYLDKVAAFAKKPQPDEPVRVTGETDRVYLETTATCVVHDSGHRRRIVIDKTGSNTTVLWNPWIEKARAMADFGNDEWRRMVCVETANVGDAAVRLAPGDLHRMTAHIAVETER